MKNQVSLKFIYSEKATKFCEIFPLLFTTVHTVKSKGKILQNFVAFSEYMNFTHFTMQTIVLIYPVQNHLVSTYTICIRFLELDFGLTKIKPNETEKFKNKGDFFN